VNNFCVEIQKNFFIQNAMIDLKNSQKKSVKKSNKKQHIYGQGNYPTNPFRPQRANSVNRKKKDAHSHSYSKFKNFKSK